MFYLQTDFGLRVFDDLESAAARAAAVVRLSNARVGLTRNSDVVKLDLLIQAIAQRLY
jgi:hypothetical protein